MTIGLTHQQASLLRFIEQRMKKDGVAPSFDEMRERMDLRSKSSVMKILDGLEERGFIRRLPRQARAIELVHKNSIVVCLHCGHPAGSKACRAAADLDRALRNPSLQDSSKVIGTLRDGSAQQ